MNARRTILLPSIFAFCFLAMTLFFAQSARAQDDDQKGIDQGNYNIKQSIEFGGRFTSIGGDTPTYDTFVNLQQGPRLAGIHHRDALAGPPRRACSTACTSVILVMAATPTMFRGCASAKTSGTTSTRFSGATKTSRTTPCSRIL